jgi:diguanylate cyclase (GGDEF)-like protein
MVLNRCRSQSVTIGLLFIDVDRFKQLNDVYGHQFGDLVLKRVTTAIARVTRSGDVLARYGGEEFAILASDITVEELRDLAERVRARVEVEEIRCGEKRVSVTVSVGGSIVIPRRHDTEFSQWFIATADAAMYQCKLSGRNKVEVCSLLDDATGLAEETKVVPVAYPIH